MLIIKYLSLVTLLISFILFCIVYLYFFYNFNLDIKTKLSFNLINTFFIVDNFFFNEYIILDFFSLTLVFLSYTIGFLTLITTDSKITKNYSLSFLYLNFFILITHGFAFSPNLVNMFIFYELLLLPSFFFIYNVGYTQRSTQACIYFIL